MFAEASDLKRSRDINVLSILIILFENQTFAYRLITNFKLPETKKYYILLRTAKR